ncbi:MAG: hypothetical protein BZ137_00490 [Methanosphaera sp. rholeuAM130]|nr:MAG: hypothetical protein BZ137_00490 [Methanosphaera sp. rholeuAM130]
MSNNNYIIRENFIAEVYHDDDELLNTEEILQDKYGYISKSISDEGYKLEHPECNLFKELLYEDKVVGFVTYDFTNGVGDFSLNEIYVLPEYRGNKYFISEVEYMLMSGSTISIYEPTHRLIEIMLDNDFAKKLDNNLVLTSINLDVDEKKTECNVEDQELDEDLIHSCNLYDLNISACIILDDITNDNIIHYSRCLDDDNKYYSAGSIRENLNKQYFENIKDTILSNHEKYVDIMMELEDQKPKANFDFDEVIGRPPNLSGYLEGLIEEDLITRQKALDIQAQMIDEYDNGLILSESLLRRLEYLSMEDLINQEKEEEGFESDEFYMKCPYCDFPTTPLDKTCEVCGFKLDNDPLDVGSFDDVQNGLINSIIEMKNDGLSDEEIMDLTKEFIDEMSDGSEYDDEKGKMLLEFVSGELNNLK